MQQENPTPTIVVDEPGTPAFDYAVCVPYHGQRDGDHLDCMNALGKRHGLPGYRLIGCSYIDLARAALARIVEKQGHKGLVFIDHDIVFDPDDVIALIEAAEREQCVVSGVYSMRATADRLIGCFAPEVKEVTFFRNGGLYPGVFSGLGFTAIPMRILDDVGRNMPRLKTGFIDGVRPMFALRSHADTAPLLEELEHLLATWKEPPGWLESSIGSWHTLRDIVDRHAIDEHYSGEDTSFFHRLSKAGHRLLLDTRPRLYHKGSYFYGVEDGQIAVPRARQLNVTLKPRPEAPPVAASAEQFEGFEQPIGALGISGPTGACQHVHVDAETGCIKCGAALPPDSDDVAAQ